uniref:Uncharacterized protein n=1 Tax=Acidobacterium capsulatum TaxID=33075 RepID=A0A7V4XQ38_9BACT
MLEETSRQDLKERLALIETMMAEGRQTTQRWGWSFLLWGVAYYIAIAWTDAPHGKWAWPITMGAAVLLSFIIASRSGGDKSRTTMSRAVGSIWLAFGMTAFLLFVSLGISGRLTDLRVFIAVVAAMLGMANGASGYLLGWRVQMGCAVIWWITAVSACFLSVSRAGIIFLIAIFFCQIVFGVYGMLEQHRTRIRRKAIHA